MKKFFFFIFCFTAFFNAGAINLLQNSSFELGTATWGIRTVIPKEDRQYRVIREKLSSGDAVHGLTALELPNPNGYSVQLCSTGIPVSPGKYTFSVWLKASRTVPVELQFFSPEKNNWHCPAKKLSVSTEWKRYEFCAVIPDGHLETVVRIQFNTPATLCVDAAQMEPGERATAYAPSALTEAALIMPGTWLTAGKHDVELLAIRHTGNGGKTEFCLTAENRITGWKKEIRKTLSLPVGKTIRATVPFPLENRGFIKLGGTFREGSVFPFYIAVMNPLPSGKFSPEQGFCVGINETGVFRRTGGDHNPYQGLGIDFAEHLEMLHATGVSLIRLFEYELSEARLVNPKRGIFDFANLNRYLDAVAKSDLVPYICIDTGAFSYKPHSTKPRDTAKNNWFMVKDGEKGTINPIRSVTVYPKMSDWRAYVNAYIRNCKGRVRYYEILNEPNLRLTDAARYVSYLKEAYHIAKTADPECRIIGICATEDYGATGGYYTGECAEKGAFQYLDAVSFHPYEAALDTSEIPAAQLLEKLNALRKKYRPGVQIWNSELFYIHSLRDKQKYRWTNPQFLRPQNLARRYLIDLGEGIQASTPLCTWQLFAKVYTHQDADQSWYGHKAIPNAAAVAQNAFVHFLRGAVSLGKAELPDGMNGYHYRTHNGREITAIWALEENRKFIFSVPAEISVCDLFGNPIDCTSGYLLSESPLYLEGKNLKSALKKIVFQPQIAILIPGSRFRDSSTLAIELQNRKNEPQSLTARIKGEKEIRSFIIPENNSRTIHFQTRNPHPELLWISGGKQERQPLKPIPARKTMESGKTVTLNNSVSFSAEAQKTALVIAVSVKDRKRGERTVNQPWTGDCIELFLDTKPENRLDNHLPGDSVFRLFLAPASSNGLPAELSGSRNLDIGKLKWNLKDSGTDYSGKVEIPWSALGCSGPQELGFDIIVDNAEGKKRIACHAWAGDDRNCYSRFQFGRLLLNKSDRK